MENNKLKQTLTNFIGKNQEELNDADMVIKQDKSLIEVTKITKKIITEDGRQLLT